MESKNTLGLIDIQFNKLNNMGSLKFNDLLPVWFKIDKIKIEENEGLNRAVVDSAVAVGEGYSINKHSTDAEIKNDAASLMEDHNIDYKFSNIKRNDKDEIIAIKIEFNDNKGHKGEKVINGTEPIKPIHFTIDIDKNGKKQCIHLRSFKCQ